MKKLALTYLIVAALSICAFFLLNVAYDQAELNCISEKSASQCATDEAPSITMILSAMGAFASVVVAVSSSIVAVCISAAASKKKAKI